MELENKIDEIVSSNNISKLVSLCDDDRLIRSVEYRSKIRNLHLFNLEFSESKPAIISDLDSGKKFLFVGSYDVWKEEGSGGYVNTTELIDRILVKILCG